MIKAIFKKALPTLRMEAGCALSVVGVFLFLEYKGHLTLPKEMMAMWRAGEIGEWILAAALLMVGLGCLLLPFLSCAIGSSVRRRFAALTLAFTVFVLVCAEGWSASEAISRIHDGPQWIGVPWNGVFGAVALLELGVLLYGGIAVLSDRPLLTTLVGTRNVDASLLAMNLGVTAVVLILFRLWVDVSPAEAALLTIHLIFAMTLLRAPSESPKAFET